MRVFICDACRGDMLAVHFKARLVLNWVCMQFPVHLGKVPPVSHIIICG